MHVTASGGLMLLLSFAIGGLLGDVFLHLLPEAFAHAKNSESIKLYSIFKKYRSF